MNKKSMNLILAIAVLLIWGGSAYRVIGALSDNDEPALPSRPVVKQAANDYAQERDTMHLKLNYRDPFGIAAGPVKKDTTARTERTLIKQPSVKAALPDISFIKYAGFIANPVSKRTLIILVINGKAETLTEGESAGGIRLLKTMRDSVKIVYQKQIRYIVKS